jgi:hypothetical protein
MNRFNNADIRKLSLQYLYIEKVKREQETAIQIRVSIRKPKAA